MTQITGLNTFVQPLEIEAVLLWRCCVGGALRWHSSTSTPALGSRLGWPDYLVFTITATPFIVFRVYFEGCLGREFWDMYCHFLRRGRNDVPDVRMHDPSTTGPITLSHSKLNFYGDGVGDREKLMNCLRGLLKHGESVTSGPQYHALPQR